MWRTREPIECRLTREAPNQKTSLRRNAHVTQLIIGSAQPHVTQRPRTSGTRSHGLPRVEVDSAPWRSGIAMAVVPAGTRPQLKRKRRGVEHGHASDVRSDSSTERSERSLGANCRRELVSVVVVDLLFELTDLVL
jgi:hypothetical protein